MSLLGILRGFLNKTFYSLQLLEGQLDFDSRLDGVKTIILSRINLVLDHCFEFARANDLSECSSRSVRKVRYYDATIRSSIVTKNIVLFRVHCLCCRQEKSPDKTILKLFRVHC